MTLVGTASPVQSVKVLSSYLRLVLKLCRYFQAKKKQKTVVFLYYEYLRQQIHHRCRVEMGNFVKLFVKSSHSGFNSDGSVQVLNLNFCIRLKGLGHNQSIICHKVSACVSCSLFFFHYLEPLVLLVTLSE